MENETDMPSKIILRVTEENNIYKHPTKIDQLFAHLLRNSIVAYLLRNFLFNLIPKTTVVTDSNSAQMTIFYQIL